MTMTKVMIMLIILMTLLVEGLWWEKDDGVDDNYYFKTGEQLSANKGRGSCFPTWWKHEERGRFGPFRQNTLSLQRYIAGKRAKQTQLPTSFENKETLPQARMFEFHLQPYVEVTTTILSTYVFSVLLWLAPRILFSVSWFSNFQDEHFLRPP